MRPNVLKWTRFRDSSLEKKTEWCSGIDKGTRQVPRQDMTLFRNKCFLKYENLPKLFPFCAAQNFSFQTSIYTY